MAALGVDSLRHLFYAITDTDSTAPVARCAGLDQPDSLSSFSVEGFEGLPPALKSWVTYTSMHHKRQRHCAKWVPAKP
eukprot:CAMPEP_0172790242 /NCGR_PEP_ID=MMETSP1074-20121228/207865_1 /TAXON_ID=2916 /ORGANISM="Ceratium fusus, Strain PA161109" /LENGTH=77 /DNA_ID=CAMNT_0013627287 /DNA_START=661 /DNA_END=894 /DNA_ORIENTATION=+